MIDQSKGPAVNQSGDWMIDWFELCWYYKWLKRLNSAVLSIDKLIDKCCEFCIFPNVKGPSVSDINRQYDWKIDWLINCWISLLGRLWKCIVICNVSDLNKIISKIIFKRFFYRVSAKCSIKMVGLATLSMYFSVTLLAECVRLWICKENIFDIWIIIKKRII